MAAEIVEEQDQQEQTVEWDKAAEFFNGKPADADTDADAAPQDEPELVEVSFKGRKVKMAPEDAAAFEDWRQEIRERDGRLGGENARLSERLARLEGRIEEAGRRQPAEQPSIKPPPPELAIEDFGRWQQEMTEYQAFKMAEMAAELEHKYQTAEATKTQQAQIERSAEEYKEQFYTAYSHLDTPHTRPLVVSVYQAHRDELASISNVEDQQARLAELCDAHLLAIKSAGNEVPNTRTHNRPPRVEGPSSPGAGKPTSAPERKPMSAADWQAKARARMRGEKVA